MLLSRFFFYLYIDYFSISDILLNKEVSMPIKKCTVKNKKGWKYGSSGKCYIGKNSKKKASIQGYMIKKSGWIEK